MKKQIAVVEYGTSLHLVDSTNKLVAHDFWGEGHAEKANNKMKELMPNWHQFVPIERES